MHSFQGTFGTEFVYNSDLSGDIIIRAADPAVPPLHTTWDDIRAFYLEMKRKKLIAQLEMADYDELENM